MEILLDIVDTALYWLLTVMVWVLVVELVLIAGIFIAYIFIEGLRALWFFLLVAVFVCLIPVEIMRFLYRFAVDVVRTARRPDFDGADIGIDLVAEERDGGYCAIQCKCYAPGTRVAKAHIDSFISASARDPFTRRIIVDTGDDWGRAAVKIVTRVKPECQVLRFGDLASRPFDWPDLVRGEPQDLAYRREPYTLRPHQQTAFDSDAAKIIGCWQALQNPENDPEANGSGVRLKRAIAFTNTILSSKRLEKHWNGIVDQAIDLRPEARRGDALRCEIKHVDGQHHALDRKGRIDWLKGKSNGACRILSNARCLSEGIDVPALDAVLFMSSRSSQVDIVQAVGRAMRKSDGKEYGYFVLPVTAPAGTGPALALNDNKRFAGVWGVLRALRSHDGRFNAEIYKIDLNETPTSRIIFSGDGAHGGTQPSTSDLPFPPLDLPPGAIFAKIVERCGDRKYWETWAKDVADIFSRLVNRIENLLANPGNGALREWFGAFHEELRISINDSITRDHAIEMMAQHILTRPVFEALFEHYDVASGNPVAQALDSLRRDFGEFGLENETRDMERFYESVRMRARGLDNSRARQRVLMELHANEIVLLAYYIAAIHIEEAFHGRRGSGAGYEPFKGIVLTDTFNLNTDRTGFPGDWLPDNSERVERQQNTPIQVIVGNPPWSVGQRSSADDDPNVEYPELENRVADTYAARSTATLKNSLYDTYKMAIRWASDRIGDQGVVALVTNGSWIDGNVDSGVRACLVDEFTSIFVMNLRGNQRTQGERSRQEGGKVFGQGSRAPVAITILIRNPDAGRDGCRILYHDIGDYLKREKKLEILRTSQSIGGIEDWRAIAPDKHHDWVGQRDEAFQAFYPMGTKAAKAGKADDAIFKLYSRGLATSRDAYIYNFSRDDCAANARAVVHDYMGAMQVRDEHPEYSIDESARRHSKSVRWDQTLKDNLARRKSVKYSTDNIWKTQYRPFVKQNCYVDYVLVNRKYQMDRIFPAPDSENRAICVPGVGSKKPFSVLMVDSMPDIQLMFNGQCFPRYRFAKPPKLQDELPGIETDLKRVDNISDAALRAFRVRYSDSGITKDDIFHYIYGILHAPEYRERFSNDLAKHWPRIPFAPDFPAFAAAVLFGKTSRLELDMPQCLLRVARFRGSDRTEFLDNRQFHGNAFALLWAAERFLRETLPIAGRIEPDRMERIDEPLVPPLAVREALANAFCHRDYSIGGGSVGVAIYDDRLEVTSSGSLHFGLTPEMLFAPHESLPWNPRIARAFYLRGIIEEWGRGTLRIESEATAAGLPRPEIEDAGGCVTVRFRYRTPLDQLVSPARPVDTSAISDTVLERDTDSLTELQSAIVNILDAAATPLAFREIRARLPDSISGRQVKRALARLRILGHVHSTGRGIAARWARSEDSGSGT